MWRRMTIDDADLAVKVLRADARLGYATLARDEVADSLRNGEVDGAVWEIYQDARGRKVLWAYRHQRNNRYRIPCILHVSVAGTGWREGLAIWRERLLAVARMLEAKTWVTIFFQKSVGGALHPRYVEGLKIPELDKDRIEVHEKDPSAVRFTFRVSSLG